MGRMGQTGQCCPFCPFLCFLCSHPVFITSEDMSRCIDNGSGGTSHVTPSALRPRSKITVINGIFGDICIARLGGRAAHKVMIWESRGACVRWRAANGHERTGESEQPATAPRAVHATTAAKSVSGKVRSN